MRLYWLIQKRAPYSSSNNGQVYAELGEIVEGRKKGRTDDQVITLFDSTGLAIEDIAVAKLLYNKALKTGTGLRVNLVD
jgi:alanine dehydrogenase